MWMADAGPFTDFFLDCFATDGVPCWGIAYERLLCRADLGNSNAQGNLPFGDQGGIAGDEAQGRLVVPLEQQTAVGKM
jgi:hypothetical protein